MNEDVLQFWEFLSYVATVIAATTVPAAVLFYFSEKKKEYAAEKEASRIEREENYSRLMAEYRKLQIWYAEKPEIWDHKNALVGKDLELQRQYYSMMIGVLEESFMLFYVPEDAEYMRMWHSWDDYINELLALSNFRGQLDRLLHGEDERFIAYMEEKMRVPA